ncbi:MAG: nuclease-related domain-containing protein [Egibacteraceae bacterium]
MQRRGWVVLHDLAIRGSRANIDHLLIGPPGVVVIDSKRWKGMSGSTPPAAMAQLLPRPLSHRRAVLASHHHDRNLSHSDLCVFPILCIHRAGLARGGLFADHVPIVGQRDLVPTVCRIPRVLDHAQIAQVAARVRAGFVV